MQYYLIEWEHEEPDDPWQVYLELDNAGHLTRRIDAYRFGLYEPFESSDAPMTDPRQVAGDSGSVSKIHAAQFQDLWERCREMPEDFMSIYF